MATVIDDPDLKEEIASIIDGILSMDWQDVGLVDPNEIAEEIIDAIKTRALDNLERKYPSLYDKKERDHGNPGN